MSNVVRVVGELNGTQITFSLEEDGRWSSSPIPNDITGEYIIQVTAYDEAGNEAYNTAMLFTVDLNNLNVRLVPLKYSANAFEATDEKDKLSEFVYLALESKYNVLNVPQDFSIGGEWVK